MKNKKNEKDFLHRLHEKYYAKRKKRQRIKEEQKKQLEFFQERKNYCQNNKKE